jgi:hypothetical protein
VARDGYGRDRARYRLEYDAPTTRDALLAQGVAERRITEWQTWKAEAEARRRAHQDRQRNERANAAV